MLTTENEIASLIGVRPNYMRPPYGDCNYDCASVMRKLNYQVVQWNVDSDDWRIGGSNAASAIYDNFRSNIESELQDSGDDIMSFVSLQHDTLMRSVDVASISANLSFLTSFSASANM